jgi:hypothetical protein
MRSSPLLLLSLVVLGFGALAVPLAWLTQARPATPPALAPEPTGNRVNTLVRLRFSHPPVKVSVKEADRVIATLDTPADNPIEITDTLALEHGMELTIESAWPAGTRWTAVTIEIEPDGIEARSATRWTDSARLTEVVSFFWP